MARNLVHSDKTLRHPYNATAGAAQTCSNRTCTLQQIITEFNRRARSNRQFADCSSSKPGRKQATEPNSTYLGANAIYAAKRLTAHGYTTELCLVSSPPTWNLPCSAILAFCFHEFRISHTLTSTSNGLFTFVFMCLGTRHR